MIDKIRKRKVNNDNGIQQVNEYRCEQNEEKRDI